MTDDEIDQMLQDALKDSGLLDRVDQQVEDVLIHSLLTGHVEIRADLSERGLSLTCSTCQAVLSEPTR